MDPITYEDVATNLDHVEWLLDQAETVTQVKTPVKMLRIHKPLPLLRSQLLPTVTMEAITYEELSTNLDRVDMLLNQAETVTKVKTPVKMLRGTIKEIVKKHDKVDSLAAKIKDLQRAGSEQEDLAEALNILVSVPREEVIRIPSLSTMPPSQDVGFS